MGKEDGEKEDHLKPKRPCSTRRYGRQEVKGKGSQGKNERGVPELYLEISPWKKYGVLTITATEELCEITNVKYIIQSLLEC